MVQGLNERQDKGINDMSVVVGAAIMGDGTVGLILDAAGIIELARQR